MSDRSRWGLILGGSAVIVALVMQGPQWIHSASPLYKGIPIRFNSDEPVYLARVQESLSGRPEQSAEAFTGQPGLVGSQFAFIERHLGTFFRVSGLRAAEVFVVMDSVTPALIFLSLFFFFRLFGLSRRAAWAASVAFCVIELYSLNRPIHMRESFLLMLWSLIAVVFAWRGRWWGAIIGGGLLGMLVGVYFWSFAFAWAFWGIVFAWELLEWLYGAWRKHERLAHTRVRQLLVCGVIGVIAALPAVMEYVAMMSNPLYEYASFRSGMHPGRLPESIAYSFIFAIAVCCSLVALRRHYDALRPYRPAFAMLFAAFLFMNQQIIHGVVFNFVSHSILSLATAALGIVALAVTTRNQWLLTAACALVVYLGAIAYDGRYVISQWTFEEGRLGEQHFVSALPVLDALPRAMILSDLDTSSFIAGHTKHDVVYSIYLKNVLMTHDEIARRFCLVLLPLPPEEKDITGMEHLVYPDAVSAFGDDVRQKEEALVHEACAQVERDPAAALKAFGVDYVLSDTRRSPQWNAQKLRVALREEARGDGWVLYAIR